MIRDKSIEGSFLDVKLEPKPFPLHAAAKDADATNLEPQIITLRFEMQDKAVTELRAELVFKHADYIKAEQAGRFGLDASAREAAMGGTSFATSEPVHVLVRADLGRIGPYQFDGLDLMNNENDLLEIVMTMTNDTRATSPYHQFATWSAITVQQKSGDGQPIGFDP